MPNIESAAMAWVILAVIAAVVEVSIPHFGLIFVSVGAVAAAIASGVGFGFTVQILVFVVALGVSLGAACARG